MASVVWIHEYFLFDSSLYKYAEHFYILSIFKIKLFLVFVMPFMIANQRVKLCDLCNKKINTKGIVFFLKKIREKKSQRKSGIKSVGDLSCKWTLLMSPNEWFVPFPYFKSESACKLCNLLYVFNESNRLYGTGAQTSRNVCKKKKKQRTNI